MRFKRLLTIFAFFSASISVAGCASKAVPQNISKDYRQACYSIEGNKICLTNGRAETEAAPGSAAKIETAVFGEPRYGDLDGDGTDDAVVFLSHQAGGSGTFYYVAAALHADGSAHGTNAVFLGDRVVPQTIAIRNRVVIVDYFDRRPDESMATPPSVHKSKYLTLKGGRLTETSAP